MASEPVETGVNAVLGAAAGATYGFIIFARKREDTKRETEGFDPAKLIPTVVVAALLGAADGAANGPEAITIGGIASRLAMYGGLIFALEQVYKILRDRYRNAKADDAPDRSFEKRRAERKRGGPDSAVEPVDAPNDPETERNDSVDLTTGADTDPKQRDQQEGNQ